MIRYDLQFFAKEGMGGEKTEPATSKKLDDARKEGQVAKSREIANGLGLLALFLILKFWVGHIGEQLLGVFQIVLAVNPLGRAVVFGKRLPGFLPEQRFQIL